MTLAEVQRKKILYETQIRRIYREQKFKQLRHDAALRMEVNEAWMDFLKEQPDEVPQICIAHVKYIQQDHLQSFLQMVSSNSLQLIRPVASIDCWYWNCLAANNLKFMTEICTKSTCHVLANFIKNTFQACQPYYDFYISLQKKIKYSGCYLSLMSSEELSEEELQERKIIEYLESSEGSKTIVALLGFWGTYFSTTSEQIQISNFTMMLKLFNLFSQYSRIYYDKQTFRFVMTIFTFFDNMQIFSSEAQNSINVMWMAMDCNTFLQSFMKKLSGIIKKHIDYHIFYPELGQILMLIERLNRNKPGIFFELVIQVNLQSYVVGLLKRQREYQDYNECMMVALRLVNYFSSCQNFYQVFYLQGAINITKIIVHNLLFDRNLQMVTAIVLYNIITTDRHNYFLKIFELVDYEGVIYAIKEGTEVDIFEFLVRILEIYSENQVIYQKLLVQCELQQIMSRFYQEKEQKKGYQWLVRLVIRNLEFFMRDYRKVVEDMWHHAKEMNYRGQDAFLTKFQEFQQMRISQMTL